MYISPISTYVEILCYSYLFNPSIVWMLRSSLNMNGSRALGVWFIVVNFLEEECWIQKSFLYKLDMGKFNSCKKYHRTNVYSKKKKSNKITVNSFKWFKEFVIYCTSTLHSLRFQSLTTNHFNMPGKFKPEMKVRLLILTNSKIKPLICVFD